MRPHGALESFPWSLLLSESLPNWLFHTPDDYPQGAPIPSGDSDNLHRAAAGSHPATVARLKYFIVQVWQNGQGGHTVSGRLPTAKDGACCMGDLVGKSALPGPLSYCVDRRPIYSAAFECIRTRRRRWTLCRCSCSGPNSPGSDHWENS